MGRDRKTPQRPTDKISKRWKKSCLSNLQKALDKVLGKNIKSGKPEKILPLLSLENVSLYGQIIF